MSSITQLSDRDLLISVKCAAEHERRAMVQLIALLMELDTRKLYLGEGCSSLFTYCTQALHLSEHAAYNRIEAARAARQFPVILGHLADGALTLTAVRLLAPHLTDENHVSILEAARHKSKRDVEHLVARLQPRPDVPALIRKLPTPTALPVAQEDVSVSTPFMTPSLSTADPTSMSVARTWPAEVKPLAPERYKIQFTVSRETYEQLRRAQDLLRHSIPNGDPAAIFEKALNVLLRELSKTKHGVVNRPRSASASARRSRHIPSAVKRAVWQRDGGRCAFTGAVGRCMETGFLEFHHCVPYSAGGDATIANIALRCRAHNQHEAEQDFGLC